MNEVIFEVEAPLTEEEPAMTEPFPKTERTPLIGDATLTPREARNTCRTHVTEVAMHMSKQIKNELQWYFTYAETARRMGKISFLPAHEAAQLSRSKGPESVHPRAMALAVTIQLTLDALSPRVAGVLRAAYTPRRWPLAVMREFADVAPIAVRLVCAAHPWPVRTSNDGLETAAARALATQLVRKDVRVVGLRKRARRLKTGALKAYLDARTKGGAA